MFSVACKSDESGATPTRAPILLKSLAPEISAPPDVVVVSPYYATDNDSWQVAGERAFVVAVEVPEGTDVSHLVLALQSDLPVAHQTQPGPFWRFLTGNYDANTRLFTTRLAALPPRDATFVLVSAPLIFNPQRFDVASSGAPQQINQKLRQQVGSYDFFIECRGWGSSCPPNAASTMGFWLSEIWLTLAASGFPNPLLKEHVESFYVDEANDYAETVVGWDAVLDASGAGACATAAGYYDIVSAMVFLCVPVSAIGLSLDDYDTLVHEMFHATQASYPNTYADQMAQKDAIFLMEGTAEAAVRSLGNPEMVRSEDYALRPIDISLRATDDNREYEAQDFWVYIGRVLSQGLPYTQKIFAEGANINSLKDSIPGDSLGSYFFRWARNQAIEKDVDFDGALENPCVPDVERLAKISADELPRVKTNSDAIVFDESLPRLSATMFMIDVLDVYPNNMRIFVPGADEYSIRYKIYEMTLAADNTLSADVCGGGIPEGERTIEDALLKGLDNKRYVVLVANVDVENPQRVVVVVDEQASN